MTAGYPLNTRAVFGARVYPVGTTRANGSGCGSETWQRWALVPTLADGRPALHWRDGKARHVGPRVSGKQAPAWLRRAAAYVGTVGPLSLLELAAIAEWYRTHRVGSPTADEVIPF